MIRLPPLNPSVSDPKTMSLRIALGSTARLRDHHRKRASVARSVAQTSFEQSELRTLTTSCGNCTRSCKQRNIAGNDQSPGCDRLPVYLGEKREPIGLRAYLAQLLQNI